MSEVGEWTVPEEVIYVQYFPNLIHTVNTEGLEVQGWTNAIFSDFLISGLQSKHLLSIHIL